MAAAAGGAEAVITIATPRDPYEAAQIAGLAKLMQIAVEQSCAADTEPWPAAEQEPATIPLPAIPPQAPARDDPGRSGKRRRSMLKFVKRLPLPLAIGGAVAVIAAGGGNAALAATSTPAPLQVTLSHYVPATGPADGSAAGWDAKGDVQLTVGTASGTYAKMTVNLASTGNSEPSSPPSFTTSSYTAGSPRWEIGLSNGYSLEGYPVQLGAAAKSDFTGAQWDEFGPATLPAGCGRNTYVTYTKALSCADPGGTATVTSAYVVADGQPAATVDTLTGVQYNGETLSPGTVTVTSPGDQTATAGTAVSLQVKASTDTSDPALSYSAANLPTGLSIDTATGLITGTPSAAGSFSTTVTATDAYKDTATSKAFTWTIGTGTPPPPPSASGFVADPRLPNLVVDDFNGLHANGVKAQVWQEAGSGSNGNAANQTWVVNSLSGGNVQLQLKGTSLCLDVKDFGVTNGTNIQLWACGTSVDQIWKPLAGGQLEAVHASTVSGSTMVLDDPLHGGNGTQFQIWQSNGLPQQFWNLPAAG